MTSKSKQTDEKKQRVEAPISRSSWIHRLTTTTKDNDDHSEKLEHEHSSNESDSVSSAITTTTENKIEEKETKDEDIKSEGQIESTESKNEIQKSSEGSSLWSWFGYSNGSNKSVDTASKDEKENETLKDHSNVTAIEKVDSSNQNHNNNNNNDNNDNNDNNNDENEKEQEQVQEQGPNDESADQHHHNPKQSYWKSLFISSMSEDTKQPQKDSVIISDDGDEQSIQEEITTQSKQHSKSSKSRKNVVLPSFESQFTAAPNESQPGFFNKALSAINSIFTSKTPDKDRFWKENDYLSSMVEDMKKDPENVANKRILIIGVHGWFPMKLVRSVVGEPTGTSAKFCEQMTTAVKSYFLDKYELDIPDKAIISIPLQYEGKVLDRVERLYGLLTNEYKETVESANVILWTTHSQGTPVSTILLRKLIENEVINIKKQPICLLAMAGISHGPFPSLKGNILVKYFEADAARELFEFMDSESPISIQYRDAMAFVLQNNIKTVLVGSMQDQVVPLYSAIMSGVTHPNILRAIYIDGHIYSKDDFLIRLILFSLKLRNIGLSDHGVLIHISEVLAGNLYSWEGGHSTIYEEVEVFMLPLSYLFESKPFGKLEPLKPTSLFTQFAKNQQENTNKNNTNITTTSSISSNSSNSSNSSSSSSSNDKTRSKNSSGNTDIDNNTSKETEVEDKARKRVLSTVKAKLDPFQARSKWNPFYLPWAMRGIWDDPNILHDDLLSRELEKLQDLFDRWNPSSAKLKEIKFRLEPIRARL